GLEALALELGVADRVRFSGLVNGVQTAFGAAKIFVLSSRFEGFPNVLLEAMAAGLAVASFECPSGPKEIIRDGLDGVLVEPENEEALSRALGLLMEEPERRAALGQRATEVVARFSRERVMAQWDAVVDECVRERGHRE